MFNLLVWEHKANCRGEYKPRKGMAGLPVLGTLLAQ